jgi:hypothetical protein
MLVMYRWIHFLTGSPYLVAATATTLYVWNLLTLSVWWSAVLPVCGKPFPLNHSYIHIIILEIRMIIKIFARQSDYDDAKQYLLLNDDFLT